MDYVKAYYRLWVALKQHPELLCHKIKKPCASWKCQASNFQALEARNNIEVDHLEKLLFTWKKHGYIF